MKLLVAFALIGLAAAGVVKEIPFDAPPEVDYHNKIGIPLAKRIKAAEEAQDFDGARIVGGSAASLGQYPYIAGLIIHILDSNTSFCGSSLLTNTRAVTAAHCWFTWGSHAWAYTVVLGSTTLFSGGTRLFTTDVEPHADYNPTSLANDIAIIKLPWVDYTSVIQPIALATGTNDFAGTWGWASGWGVTENGLPASLLHVDLNVISNAQCTAVFGSFYVQNTTLCTATPGGRGTCVGDSGGPLANAQNNLLIGVTSFGHYSGCGSGQPAGFARISAYVSWIYARLS